MNNRIDGILLKSQQAYLKKLGFYKGDVNGFWGDEMKAAMAEFRKSPLFAPANVRRADGPFVPFERLPKGYTWEVLDGQRCMMAKSGLPASFAVQELVNLIMQPTTAKVEKTAPVSVQGEKSQTTNLGSSVMQTTEATTAATTAIDLATCVSDNADGQGKNAADTEGHSAKGSSQQSQKHSHNNGQQRPR